MGHQALHDFGVGVFHAAEVAAEAILVELFVRLAVPQAAGVGADLVGENDLAVDGLAELELEVDERDAALAPKCLERVVDGEGILLDELDFLPGRELEGNGVIGCLLYTSPSPRD